MTENQTKKCHFCGEDILTVAVKCKHCGSDLTQYAAQQVPNKSPSKAQDAEKKKPGCLKVGFGIVVLAIGAIALIGGLFSGGGDVLPLSDRMLEKYGEAYGNAAMKLFDKRDELNAPVRASIAVRMAVTELGYDPDKTILYLLSDEFQEKMKAGTLEELAKQVMGGELLLSLALGVGSSDQEFDQLLSYWSPEVQAAAKKQRDSK